MDAARDPGIINERYLLVIFSLPFHVDANGDRYLDALWVKDLKQHVAYLPHLTLASPRRNTPPPAGFIAVDTVAELAALRYIDLPYSDARRKGLLNLPRTIRRLWQAITETDIVHSSIAAWPIAEAWLVTPMLMLRRRFHIIIVESAPWRMAIGQAPSRKARLKAAFYEYTGKHCLARADLRLFTQAQYRDSLLGFDRRCAHVVPASWIDESVIRSDAEIASDWAAKGASPVLHIAFAGRLTRSKGILLLLDAARSFANTGRALQLTIYGDGELRPDCERIAAEPMAYVDVVLGGVLPYDQSFFDAVRAVDLVVIPSLSDEQPRIVFDAFSQGIPVIASKTPGLKDCFENNRQGMFFEPGSVASLVNSLDNAWRNRQNLPAMGKRAAALARTVTHRNMHATRCDIINRAMPNLVDVPESPAKPVHGNPDAT